MRFSLTAALAFAASASACYSGGQAWGGSRTAALRAADAQCRDWDTVVFEGGENKYGCKNLGGNVRVNFRMRNGDNGGPRRTLDYGTCVDRLKSQIANCNFGGEDNQGAWRPRADPNVGSC
ncbi:hypothetical protein LY78DRAFT_685799 [Colletotrichum sublineola]|nr:hypothetical protein LY78DRAFT_685799 [Colletotrichum sublineola]